MPRRWYSAQRKMALMTYPPIKIKRNASWRLGWWYVSKMLSSIKPAAPAIPNRIEMMLRTFWAKLVFFARRPVCLSQRSDRNPISRQTTVITLPVMKSG